LSGGGDSTFGQEVPIVERFGIQVEPIQHEYVLPYDSASFDALLSVGVLEHVANERASLAEIAQVLKPQGLFFASSFPPNFLGPSRSIAGLELTTMIACIHKAGSKRCSWNLGCNC
jgi:2-polyprenyl-3-methyl-5-hydroxy-6-metoxy-1,4-benzoquinol methylase